MFLKSLTLSNIRSYEHQTIEFPTGSVLLSGDIGSGKSTILLAIEFALFGVRRKHLSGSSLLRHGKTKGEVELQFDMEGKDVLIKRVLKRGRDDVKQEAGYIVVDGMKKEGTHVELKSAILSLLGYPSDLLTKSKDLVFRYTVYTPQESMKQILLDDTESRLNTLRKVFNIDKYKRIRENAAIYSSHLREKSKLYEGLLLDLPLKEKELVERKALVSTLDRDLATLRPSLESAAGVLKEKTASVASLEETIKVTVELRKQLAVAEQSLHTTLEQHQRTGKDIEVLQGDIEILSKDDPYEIEDVASAVASAEIALREAGEKQLALAKRKSEVDVTRRQATETITKISSLDNCPLCLQQVAHSHKSAIISKEETTIKRATADLAVVVLEEKKVVDLLQKIQEELVVLRKKQADMQAALLRKKNLDEKKERVVVLQTEKNGLKGKIGQINVSKQELQAKLDAQKDVDTIYASAKFDLEKAREEERILAINMRELEVKKEEGGKAIVTLETDIATKKGAELSLLQVKEYQQWISEFFINLMATMEKHVMLSVYHEFNDLFKEWFSVLLEDETLSVRLDDEFTPIVEQNGYESAFEYLSGGEKTSIALAYRLALNKVINDVISDMKTKDFLILDEPTDGFSSEQLDRMRLVLEQLDMKQVIIVSHETKIETLVDHVIRVRKEEHVSSIENR
ncbi:MAG: SMC family ATPase [Nanoarchaeota archaeon]|nr:SMC family ATPase [Nanoarchaeota archaeon]